MASMFPRFVTAASVPANSTYGVNSLVVDTALTESNFRFDENQKEEVETAGEKRIKAIMKTFPKGCFSACRTPTTEDIDIQCVAATKFAEIVRTQIMKMPAMEWTAGVCFKSNNNQLLITLIKQCLPLYTFFRDVNFYESGDVLAVQIKTQDSALFIEYSIDQYTSLIDKLEKELSKIDEKEFNSKEEREAEVAMRINQIRDQECMRSRLANEIHKKAALTMTVAAEMKLLAALNPTSKTAVERASQFEELNKNAIYMKQKVADYRTISHVMIEINSDGSVIKKKASLDNSKAFRDTDM